MTTIKNIGKCLLCDQVINHRSATMHIKKCIKQHALDSSSEKKEKIFLIKVYAGKEFWLYIEINGSSTLDDLDCFLRKKWLECCGHMSQFTIHGTFYSSNGEMEKAIHRIMPVNTAFDYEYDFGSTTRLQGKAISERSGELQKKIRLISQNEMPSFVQCTTCKKTPKVVCSVCFDFCCKTCEKKHIKSCEGEDFMLPVVNSPRMGECGYCGPE
jgi:hypothetical protein